MRVVIWRVDTRGALNEIDHKLWGNWIFNASTRLGAVATTSQQPIFSAWFVKVLVFYVAYKMMRWIFDAFEIPILGSMANLVLIVLAFDQLLLSPLHSMDAWYNKVNNFFSFLDADEEGQGIRERRAVIWGFVKKIILPILPTD